MVGAPLSRSGARPAEGWEAGALLVVSLFILAFGLATLYSVSSVLATGQGLPDTYYLERQGLGVIVGAAVLVTCALLRPSVWDTLAWPLLLASVASLVVLVLPNTHAIAPEINGARRWLRLGVTLQPSEFAKLAIVIWTAAATVRLAPRLRSLTRGLFPFLAVWTAIAVLIALEPDLSTALLVLVLGVIVAFAGGARVAHFVLLGGAAIPFLVGQLSVEFRQERIAAFLNPSSDPSGSGFQATQSLLAAGSGGAWGVGFGEGRQKFGFLPEAHNDFIFSMIAEEWGLIGVILLVAAYTALVVIGFRIAARARSSFEELLVIGMVAVIALQAALHMAVGLALVPTTGLALPLVSYGRSSLVVTMAAIGIIMAVARASVRGEVGRA